MIKAKASASGALVLACGCFSIFPAPAQAARTQRTVDVCIYGATPAGITAAIAARQEGSSVVLVEPSRWVGGILGAGIKITQDCPEERAVGGLTRKKMFTFTRKPPETPAQLRRDFLQWLREEGIEVVYERRIVSVDRAHGILFGARFEESKYNERAVPPAHTNPGESLAVTAKVFIDASYEGDLMKMAGVKFSTGRESSATYDEKPAGVNLPTNWTPIDPYKTPGDPSSGLLPLVDADHGKPLGAHDDYTQAYNFRFYVTSDPLKRAPFGVPKDYDPEQFELVGRFVACLKEKYAGNPEELQKHLGWIFPGWLNRREYNYQRNSLCTIAPLGLSRHYQDGDWKTRSEIWQAHMDYLAGMHHFLSTDARVPEDFRSQTAALGLDITMHDDTHGWPNQLYIRITRRMDGPYVLTLKDVLNQTMPADSVGLALYGVDTYPARRYVATQGGRIGVASEGNMFIGGSKGTRIPYRIPYRVITPRKDQCENLLVPVCFSASYIAYASARMEPVFAVLGESAGVAAAQAAEAGVAVQDIDMDGYQGRLRARGQILEWPPGHESAGQ